MSPRPSDRLLVLHQLEWRRVGADDEARHDVAERDRLLQAMAQDRRDARDEHDDGKIVEQFNPVHGAKTVAGAPETPHLKSGDFKGSRRPPGDGAATSETVAQRSHGYLKASLLALCAGKVRGRISGSPRW